MYLDDQSRPIEPPGKLKTRGAGGTPALMTRAMVKCTQVPSGPAKLPSLAQCFILVVLTCTLALLALASPFPTTSRSPSITPARHPATRANLRDHATLIVTNEDDGDHQPPATRSPVTTRVGQRGVGSTSAASAGNKRQGKKLQPIDAANLFREEVNDYPEDEIRRLLKQTPDTIKDLYNVLNTQLDPHGNLTERVASFYINEEDDGVREESVCRSVMRNIYPREATRENSLVYIPNNQEFLQVIQAEICQHPDRECSYLLDSLPYGMTSVCYQKYAYKKLLYLDPLEKRMASDLFRYPSCCSCFIRMLPIDSRSSTTNGTRSTTRQPALELMASNGSPDGTASVSQYLGSGENSTNSNNPQIADRSLDSSKRLEPSAQQRSSKQLRRPKNQTLVLSEDKVYAP